MVYLTMVGFGGQPLVLGPTVDTYVKYDKFDFFAWARVSTVKG